MIGDLLEDTPSVRVLDFVLNTTLPDFSKSDVKRACLISWLLTERTIDRFAKLGLIQTTRQISRATMYSANKDSELYKSLVELANTIHDKKPRAKEGLR